MAKDKRSFLLYADVHHTVKKLTDEKAGILFKHILSYVNDENPTTNDFIIEIVFEPIKQALKRDLRKYESICLRNKENGSKGGRPKSENPNKPKKPSGLIDNPNNPDEPKKADNDIDSDIGNDSEIDKKEKKIKYAEYISLFPSEYGKLILSHGVENTKTFIDILNNYKGVNGKKYKSDYFAILNWVVDKAKKDGKYLAKRVLA